MRYLESTRLLVERKIVDVEITRSGEECRIREFTQSTRPDVDEMIGFEIDHRTPVRTDTKRLNPSLGRGHPTD